MALPELSDMAWGILDRAGGTVGRIDFDKCAPGPRDALIQAGALEKVKTQNAKPYGRHKSMPARYGLVITDAGRKLLAERKAAVSGPTESA